MMKMKKLLLVILALILALPLTLSAAYAETPEAISAAAAPAAPTPAASVIEQYRAAIEHSLEALVAEALRPFDSRDPLNEAKVRPLEFFIRYLLQKRLMTPAEIGAAVTGNREVYPYPKGVNPIVQFALGHNHRTRSNALIKRVRELVGDQTPFDPSAPEWAAERTMAADYLLFNLFRLRMDKMIAAIVAQGAAIQPKDIITDRGNLDQAVQEIKGQIRNIVGDYERAFLQGLGTILKLRDPKGLASTLCNSKLHWIYQTRQQGISFEWDLAYYAIFEDASSGNILPGILDNTENEMDPKSARIVALHLQRSKVGLASEVLSVPGGAAGQSADNLLSAHIQELSFLLHCLGLNTGENRYLLLKLPAGQAKPALPPQTPVSANAVEEVLTNTGEHVLADTLRVFRGLDPLIAFHAPVYPPEAIVDPANATVAYEEVAPVLALLIHDLQKPVKGNFTPEQAQVIRNGLIRLALKTTAEEGSWINHWSPLLRGTNPERWKEKLSGEAGEYLRWKLLMEAVAQLDGQNELPAAVQKFNKLVQPHLERLKASRK